MSTIAFTSRLAVLAACLLMGQGMLCPVVQARVTPATSVEQAIERAQKSKKDCLIFAYGDWDSYSSDIYNACWKNSSAMNKELENSTVVVEVNYPETVTEKDRKSFEKKSKGYPGTPPCLPSVAFVDSNGFHYATLSGSELGGEEKLFAQALAEVQKKRMERDEILKQAKLKKGVEKARAIGSAANVKGIKTDNKTLLALVKECDPSDISGYVRSLSFDIFKLQDEIQGDPIEKVTETLDKIINDEGYTKEQRQMVLGLKASTLSRAGGDHDKEIQAAYKKMYSLDPESLFGKVGRRGLQNTFSMAPLMDLMSKPEKDALAELDKIYNDKEFPYSDEQLQDMLDLRVRILSGANGKENRDEIIATYKKLIEVNPKTNLAEFAQQEIDDILNPGKRKERDRISREEATQKNEAYGEEIYPDDD